MNYPAASGQGINRNKFLIAASSGVPACVGQVKLIYPDGEAYRAITDTPFTFETCAAVMWNFLYLPYSWGMCKHTVAALKYLAKQGESVF